MDCLDHSCCIIPSIGSHIHIHHIHGHHHLNWQITTSLTEAVVSSIIIFVSITLCKNAKGKTATFTANCCLYLHTNDAQHDTISILLSLALLLIPLCWYTHKHTYTMGKRITIICFSSSSITTDCIWKHFIYPWSLHNDMVQGGELIRAYQKIRCIFKEKLGKLGCMRMIASKLAKSLNWAEIIGYLYQPPNLPQAWALAMMC